MLSHIRIDASEGEVNIKPHLNFSYGRGVIFNKDLCEFSEEEILDMCPMKVWKVHKVSKTSMIVLTFEDPDVPMYIHIENERLKVRPFKAKPLQCFNCFKFGHPSSICRNDKLCGNCSRPEHGDCKNKAKCINCSLDHIPSDKRCSEYKIEESVLNRSGAEYVSIGYVKRIISRSLNYAKALKTTQSPNAVNTAPNKNLSKLATANEQLLDKNKKVPRGTYAVS